MWTINTNTSRMQRLSSVWRLNQIVVKCLTSQSRSHAWATQDCSPYGLIWTAYHDFLTQMLMAYFLTPNRRLTCASRHIWGISGTREWKIYVAGHTLSNSDLKTVRHESSSQANQAGPASKFQDQLPPKQHLVFCKQVESISAKLR